MSTLIKNESEKENREVFRNPETGLTEEEKFIISIHWKHNRHHPEFFYDINDMTDLDILEMTVDWFARSLEYKTNFMEFVEKRQENRFKFPDNIYSKVVDYCKLIEKLYNNNQEDGGDIHGN